MLHIHFISIWIYTDWITYIITIFCRHFTGSSRSCIANCFSGFRFQRFVRCLDGLSNFSWLNVSYPIFGYVSWIICDACSIRSVFWKLVLLCSISLSSWNKAFVPFRCFRFLLKRLPPRVSAMYYRGVPCFRTNFLVLTGCYVQSWLFHYFWVLSTVFHYVCWNSVPDFVVFCLTVFTLSFRWQMSVPIVRMMLVDLILIVVLLVVERVIVHFALAVYSYSRAMLCTDLYSS